MWHTPLYDQIYKEMMINLGVPRYPIFRTNTRLEDMTIQRDGWKTHQAQGIHVQA